MRKNMLGKKIALTAITMSMAFGSSVLPVLATPTAPIVNQGIVTPYDMDIGSGEVYNATQWSDDWDLKKSNGATVNFWIENTGTVDVVITINGKNSRTIEPGKDGHISASVGTFSSKYKFKAVPSPNGGKISIKYSIAQRD